MTDDHHDNRYEDGDMSTGTVVDYPDFWSRTELPDWIRIIRIDHIPGVGGYAVEIDSGDASIGWQIHFKGTLSECQFWAIKVPDWEPVV